MIELHFWPTPNGYKISIFLEEASVPYTVVPVNIGVGDQFKPDFLKIAPNNRMPAIVDRDPADKGAPISVFESGAILVYLAEKTGKFLSKDLRKRYDTLQWLFWQMGGLGPMAGQANHFNNYAPEKLAYAMDRYTKETGRLYAVLDKQLKDRDFVAGDYSIADMAAYPWTLPYDRQGLKIEDFPNLKRWQERIKARPAVARAYEKGEVYRQNAIAATDPAARKILFGQSAATVRGN